MGGTVIQYTNGVMMRTKKVVIDGQEVVVKVYNTGDRNLKVFEDDYDRQLLAAKTRLKKQCPRYKRILAECKTYEHIMEDVFAYRELKSWNG